MVISFSSLLYWLPCYLLTFWPFTLLSHVHYLFYYLLFCLILQTLNHPNCSNVLFWTCSCTLILRVTYFVFVNITNWNVNKLCLCESTFWQISNSVNLSTNYCTTQKSITPEMKRNRLQGTRILQKMQSLTSMDESTFSVFNLSIGSGSGG